MMFGELFNHSPSGEAIPNWGVQKKMQDRRIQRQAKVQLEIAGQRADKVAALLFPEFSRTQLQHWMLSGELTADGAPIQPKLTLNANQMLHIDAEIAESERWKAESIPLNIIYEDESLLIVDKTAGMVVHPAAGNPDGTLLNALLGYDSKVSQLPRCGIVHRLDKETSGLLVVAKTLEAQTSLVRQLQARTVHRQYQAVCAGRCTAGGKVDAPIGRHPRHRVKMAVVQSGKPAITHYRVEEKFSHHTRLKLNLETGRTHQIRVHMAHINHALVGDPLYSGRFRKPANISSALEHSLGEFRRQALHATSLQFVHPSMGSTVMFDSPLPEDFQSLLEALRDNEASSTVSEQLF